MTRKEPRKLVLRLLGLLAATPAPAAAEPAPPPALPDGQFEVFLGRTQKQPFVASGVSAIVSDVTFTIQRKTSADDDLGPWVVGEFTLNREQMRLRVPAHSGMGKALSLKRGKLPCLLVYRPGAKGGAVLRERDVCAIVPVGWIRQQLGLEGSGAPAPVGAGRDTREAKAAEAIRRALLKLENQPIFAEGFEAMMAAVSAKPEITPVVDGKPHVIVNGSFTPVRGGRRVRFRIGGPLDSSTHSVLLWMLLTTRGQNCLVIYRRPRKEAEVVEGESLPAILPVAWLSDRSPLLRRPGATSNQKLRILNRSQAARHRLSLHLTGSRK